MASAWGRRRARAGALALGLLGQACLPGDERPEPGSLNVTAEPSEALASGVVTADGWSLSFERFLTAVGHIKLENDACNAYGETSYTWLYDFAGSAGGKVGLLYGLGSCNVHFDMQAPDYDSALGPGTSRADVTLMRTEGTDAYSADARAAFIVRGQARRDGVTKRFDWTFRRSYELRDCPGAAVELSAGDARSLAIVLGGEELFRAAPVDEAPLSFARIAAADADGDGAVSLAELALVDAPVWPSGAGGAGGAGDGGGGPTDGGAQQEGSSGTLSDLIYLQLLPRVARLAASGACVAEVEDHRWH